MKKVLLFAGAGALIVAASCSKPQVKKENTDSIKNVALTAQLQVAEDYKDSLLLIMDDVYTGLDMIQQQENLISSQPAGLEGDRRAAMRQDLETIRLRLANNRMLLNDMQKKLNDANDQNGLMTKTIQKLQVNIEQQEKRIAQLAKELESVKAENVQLRTDLTQTKEQLTVETQQKEAAQQEVKVAQQETQVAQQQVVATENKLNTCYYAIGTNKELKQKGLLEKKFLGSTKVLKGDFDASYFQPADQRTLTTIPCNNKKVKMWTNHPADSYVIEEAANGNKTIRITNPAKFWSLTNHLIIQVG